MIKRGDESALRAALSSGLDPNSVNQNGWSLLMLAAIEGSVPLGRLLIEDGAAIDARNRHDETALSLAAQKGHIPFIKLLREHGDSKECRPHGTELSHWLTTASGLPQEKLAEVLQALGDTHDAG